MRFNTINDNHDDDDDDDDEGDDVDDDGDANDIDDDLGTFSRKNCCSFGPYLGMPNMVKWGITPTDITFYQLKKYDFVVKFMEMIFLM